MSPVRVSRDGVSIAVWVTVGSRDEAVGGVRDGRLLVRVRAPAREGRATKAVCDAIADALGVARGDVDVTRGGTTRRKLVQVRGVNAAQARRRLGV